MMILERLELPAMALTVRCDRRCGRDLPGQVAALLVAAAECGIDSITLWGTETAQPAAARATRALAGANPRLLIAAAEPHEAPVDEFGYLVVSRAERLLLLRDQENDRRYSIYIPATGEAAGLAARIACFAALVIGFPPARVLDFRSSVNELLSNIVAHGGGQAGELWIQTTLERCGESLCVSIIDKGIEFDAGAAFGRGGIFHAGPGGGQGGALLGRISDSFRYERTNGYNRVYFNASMSCGDEHAREKTMAGFEIGAPRECSGGAAKVELRGELDSKAALAVEALLETLLEKRLIDIELDFSRVELISSAGVGALLGLVSEIRAAGGEVRLTGVSAAVRSLLRLLSLEEYLKLRDAKEATA